MAMSVLVWVLASVSGAQAYTLVKSDHWCSNSDKKLLIGHEDTLAECAAAVNADTDCSSTFYGSSGVCTCVAIGTTCLERASTISNSIYTTTQATTTTTMIT